MPSFCAYCKEWISSEDIFCTECSHLIYPITTAKLSVTPTYVLTVYALSAYQDPLKSLILAKTQSNRLASKQLGSLMWTKIMHHNLEFDCVVPIPLHWTRYAYRGYNQAEIMAEVIACRSGKPLIHMMSRKRRTALQSHLTAEQRAANLACGFALSSDVADYTGKHILLIDDLMTTGATLKAAAKTVLSMNPSRVSVVVVCRVV